MGDSEWRLVLWAIVGICVLVIVLGYFRKEPVKSKEIVSERRYEITKRSSGARSFLAACFWLWGVLVGLFCLFSLIDAEVQTTLGVGTSSAVTMRIAFWMGGLLFFGIAALISGTTSTVRIIDPVPPAVETAIIEKNSN